MLEQISPPVLMMLAAIVGLLMFVALPLAVQPQCYRLRTVSRRTGRSPQMAPRFTHYSAPLWSDRGDHDDAHVAWPTPVAFA